MAIGHLPRRVSTPDDEPPLWPCRTLAPQLSRTQRVFGRGKTTHMTNVYTNVSRRHRLRALAVFAVLLGGCDSADKLMSTDPSTPVVGFGSADSAAPSDSAALSDSLVADSVALSDSTISLDSLDLAMSASAASRSGTPFGPDGLWASYTGMRKGYQLFTASVNSDSPQGLIKRINAARAANHQLALMMTGGGHKNYTSHGKFNYAKWKRRMDGYRTPAIRAAVHRGIADGTVLMNNMLDEPNHPDWGGAINKATLDRMASYVKSIFPGLPTGVSIRWDWRPNERYKVLDFIQTQYVSRFGSATAWRDQALAAAKKNGIKLAFAFNPLNGGTVIRNCPLGRTGGKGTYGGNCRMTPAQIRSTAASLGASACALLMWKYDAAFMSKAANIKAFQDVRSMMARNTRKSCSRSR